MFISFCHFTHHVPKNRWEPGWTGSVLRACMLTCFSRVRLRPHGLQPSRPLCPWDSPGKNAGVGCHFLLQGIFPTQGSNPRLLHWQADSLPLSHLGSFKYISIYYKIVEKIHRVLSGVNCPPHWFLNTRPYSFVYTYLLYKYSCLHPNWSWVWMGACLDTRFKNSFFTSPFPVFC